jgi:hypothetical protein
MHDLLARLLAVIIAPSSATRRQRRVLGTVVLIVVLVMVLLGSLMLNKGIAPPTLLLFWGICFLLLLWSVFLAYLDVRSIKNDFRARKKEIFVATFSSPEFKRKVRAKRGAGPRPAEAGEQHERRGRESL